MPAKGRKKGNVYGELLEVVHISHSLRFFFGLSQSEEVKW
jgi:hypothetical protein